MNFKILFYVCLSMGLCLAGCQNKTKSKNSLGIEIRLSPDSSRVMVQNLPKELLSNLGADSLDFDFCRQLFAVYPMAEEEDLQDLEKPLLGTYTIKNATMSFKPDSGFRKGQYYKALVFAKNLESNLLDLLRKSSRQQQMQPLEYKFRY